MDEFTLTASDYFTCLILAWLNYSPYKKILRINGCTVDKIVIELLTSYIVYEEHKSVLKKGPTFVVAIVLHQRV